MPLTKNTTLFLFVLFALAACKNNPQAVPETTDTTGKQATIKPQKNPGSKMLWLHGGSFMMGSADSLFPDAKPLHNVTVSGFWMDEHEVTNAQFDSFVKSTNYVTVAERPLNPKDYPNIDPKDLMPGSAVFVPPAQKVSLADPLQWWQYVPGANWKHPLGPQAAAAAVPNDPVVQVCYEDAAAYAKWAGERLPTEAEWEYAARGGSTKQTPFYWGTELKPGGKFVANIYEGDFPVSNTKEDGFAGVAPVESFPPNAFGLYDMDGNVWEWCSDFYRPDYYGHSPGKNPQGPVDSFDPEEPGLIKRVQRGGSFVCSDQYCIRYRAGSRGKGEVTSASNNLGFRCVKDSIQAVNKK